MSDPFNQVPTPPGWEALADQLAEDAARQLGGMVLFIVMQPEGGKIGIGLGGVPASGVLYEMSKDVPRLLLNMAKVAYLQDEFKKHQMAQN